MAERDRGTLNFDFGQATSDRCGEVLIRGQRVQVTPVFYAYWRFAAERQNIFYRRLQNAVPEQLTNDPILKQFKFTNAYRASDRVSQYLIRNVIYRGDLATNDVDVFFRVLLFKLFNRIETWEYLERQFGEISWRTFRLDAFDSALTRRMVEGHRIYSAAYIMPSASVFGGKAKHQNHLRMLEAAVGQRYPERLRKSRTMAEVFKLLLSLPSVGPFLAYQFATDLNYSELTNFSEDEFVVAGPGALDGIDKCFVAARSIAPADVIRYMWEHQEKHFAEQGINFASLWGRPLQLIDCQNVFCEISKYARVAFPEFEGVSGRTRIKQKFVMGAALPPPWYPPKWKLNARIKADLGRSVGNVGDSYCGA